MFEVILRVCSKLSSRGFMWRHVGDYITSWFDESSPPSLNHAIIFAAPCANWCYCRGTCTCTGRTVARWAAAVSATPYSEAVAQNVVGALFKIACNDSLRPHIPVEIWAWLKRQPFLPPTYQERAYAAKPKVIHHVRRLGDIDLLKSYFLLIWSEWESLRSDCLTEMEIIIREEFCGFGMWRHRKDLTERLDQVLSQLDRGVQYLQQHNPRIRGYQIPPARQQYGQLRRALVELDGQAIETLSRTSSNLVNFNVNADDCVQNPT